ncbi:MAG: single-stranded-DNA-specific exonuclease RecJ [bacterium]
MNIKIAKEWKIKTEINDEQLQSFSQFHPVIANLLIGRQINTPEAAHIFFHSSYAHNAEDPFLFSKMEEATVLVISCIKSAQPIVIYGDYDADGVTSSSVLYETLKLLKADVSIYIPDRVTEGYGMNIEAIKGLALKGTKLIITVDNGIRSKSEISFAQSLDLKVLLTDHHVPPAAEDTPDCLIINPMMPNEGYPYKFLAGVGVAAKLAVAIIRKTKLDLDLKNRLEDRILDLVAIGTVADCVRLTGENRILVKKGLEIINNHKRLGLRELIKVSKINSARPVDAWNLGFQIAPRLNAAGRVEHANAAFELLTCSDELEAQRLANSLNNNNLERQKITDEVVDYIDKNIVESESLHKIIIAVNPEGAVWNEGVIGLVAGRIAERNHKPTLVISGENNHYKGSGRSVENFNLIEALEACDKFLSKYGGHKAACGFSINGKENLEQFMLTLQEYCKNKIGGTLVGPTLVIDLALKLVDIDENLINKINAFSPFGEGNPQPIFASLKVELVDLNFMGQQNNHLKLKIRQDKSVVYSAIAFNATDKWPNLKIGAMIDLAYNLDINEFNGRREVQLRIIDIKVL